ncbi:Uma2 family endonuclease [Nocardia transvalensis]|uniref:Uma2 family endonuclease n=1 Tax=Nocardia transvalensis TaxID=37333 RepID=UPI00189595A3|nr:Uma2 family endonuclease [Nocardia transvalensis]MBF6332603.1 Uma2 family endonuclease [Nocardia transvalensis]
MTSLEVPQWLIPPAGGFTVEHFLRLRGLPKRTELIDGSLIFVAPQDKWHSRVVTLFEEELDSQAPEHLRADWSMAVRLGERQMPVPDVVVVTEEAYLRDEPTSYYHAEDVMVIVEAVSPDSEDRDRDTKPAKYAKAGIPHYWRIERSHADAVVHTFELMPGSDRYAPSGIFRDRLYLLDPFEVDIDLTAVGTSNPVR